MQKSIITVLAILSVSSYAAAQTTVSFDDLTLAPNSFFNGGPATNANGWTSGNTTFGNSFNSSFGGFWNGFAYSNVNSPNTPGFTNQYASRADPTGRGIYAVGYSGSQAFINLPPGQSPQSVLLTNTAYAYFDMLDGSSFSKKFGGTTGNDPDFFDVIFTGFSDPNASGTTTGSATFRLADFTFANNAQDYFVQSWTSFDLTPLGAASSIRISFASSDTGAFGINTPTYVAIDDLVVVPEPALLGSLAMASTLLLRRRR
jgi:Domain of unknown function (DUF4465)